MKMKDIAKFILQGVITGFSAALSIYLIISVFEGRDEPTRYSQVKNHYLVEDATFTPTAPSTLEGDRVTTVTFSVNNSTGKEINSVFVDLEFFDEEGVFLFGAEQGTPWGDYLIPPKEKDNMSIEASVPHTVDFERVSKVVVDVYELSRK